MRIAQILLAVAGLGLWGASRMAWVDVTSFDGLSHPKTTTLSGAQWSAALVPLALLVLAAAVAALAVRGWALRLLALLVAVSSAGMAYAAIGIWATSDVDVAHLAEVPIAVWVSNGRHYWGAVLTLAAAACTLAGGVLLLRSARLGGGRSTASTKYVAPGARRAAARSDTGENDMSERMMWDALDEGRDPTGDNEGR